MKKNVIIRFLFLLVISLSTFQVMSKPKIIYVFDPMCGWCFGFSGVIRNAEQQFGDSLDFEIISGGMVVGEREGPIGDFADYILSAYGRVESYSGVKFGQPYLDQLKDKSLYTSSVLPSIALEVVKSMDSSKAIAFASEMQKLHFIGGKNLSDSTVYKELLQKMDLSESVFYAGLASEDFKKKAFEVFESAKKLGVSGYPAVLALIQGKYYLVSNGFVPENELFELLEKVKTIQ
ncbi:MAG: DsbA family protein [Bacteroidia bacterium]|nr:DsbA family protein [Bacteroidia bacterium]